MDTTPVISSSVPPPAICKSSPPPAVSYRVWQGMNSLSSSITIKRKVKFVRLLRVCIGRSTHTKSPLQGKKKSGFACLRGLPGIQRMRRTLIRSVNMPTLPCIPSRVHRRAVLRNSSQAPIIRTSCCSAAAMS